MLDHMIGFLNWLNDRRLDVMYFFGTLYNQAVDVISNVAQWIRDRYYDALRYVRDSTDSLFRFIQDYYRKAIQRAWDYAVNFYNTAVNWVRGELSNLFRWISDRFAGVLRTVDFVKSFLQDLIVRLVDSAKGYLVELVTHVRTFLEGRIEAWVRFTESVKASLLREIFDIKNVLSWSTPERVETLVMFLKNPRSFVMSYFKRYFLFVLEWSLAYAIGSTRENLPPWPNWEDVV